MTEINLGKIAITNKGAWNKNEPYDKLTAVSKSGQSYLSLVPNIGIDPDTDNSMETWMLLAKKGESLYELYVNSGKFSGTEEEFLNMYQSAIDRANKAAQDALDAIGKVDSSINSITTLEQEVREAEFSRQSAEGIRISNETTRINEESNRVKAEEIRGFNEADRDLRFKTLENSINEFQQTASANEEERVLAEGQRQENEINRQNTFNDLHSNVETAVNLANEASAKAFESVQKVETSIEKNILALDMDNASGDIIISCGEDNSAFTDGVITDEGKIELNFNY